MTLMAVVGTAAHWRNRVNHRTIAGGRYSLPSAEIYLARVVELTATATVTAPNGSDCRRSRSLLSRRFATRRSASNRAIKVSRGPSCRTSADRRIGKRNRNGPQFWLHAYGANACELTRLVTWDGCTVSRWILQ